MIETKTLGRDYIRGERALTVLDDVSFIVQSGEFVSITGPSGSGKSTLANLIPRFYQHEQGEILLDGTPLQNFTLRSLRQQIALVSQNVTLFNDTVANNIAYGDLAGAPRDAIVAAAEAAYQKQMEELADAADAIQHGAGTDGSTAMRASMNGSEPRM